MKSLKKNRQVLSTHSIHELYICAYIYYRTTNFGLFAVFLNKYRTQLFSNILLCSEISSELLKEIILMLGKNLNSFGSHGVTTKKTQCSHNNKPILIG